MIMNKDLTSFTINVNLKVPHETAEACYHILEMYCRDIRGDFEPGGEGCFNGCALSEVCPILNSGENRNECTAKG